MKWTNSCKDNLPKLPHKELENLNRCLTSKEIELGIHKLPTKKSQRAAAVNSTKHLKKNINYPQALLKNRRGGNTSIMWHYPETAPKMSPENCRVTALMNIVAGILNKYCKLNSATYRKDYTS